MSHEVETMAYANEVPWHGLGTQVSDTMSPNEMLVAAGLYWTVSKRAAYTIDNPNTMCLTDPTNESSFVHVPDNHFIMRDTDNTVLSVAIVRAPPLLVRQYLYNSPSSASPHLRRIGRSQ